MDTQIILDAIDMGAWKHSLHLPKSESGYIDWYNKETVALCQKHVDSMMKATIKELVLLQAANDELAKFNA